MREIVAGSDLAPLLNRDRAAVAQRAEDPFVRLAVTGLALLFGTQAGTAPPTFVLFTSGKLDVGYERFIERRLREEFGFVGTPIVLNQRPRERRKR